MVTAWRMLWIPNQRQTLSGKGVKVYRRNINSSQSSNQITTVPGHLATASPTPVTSAAAAPVKLEKARNITFSGKAHDFATFKKSFESIVAPNRPDTEIVIRLKQAIPSKDEHLLSNVELHEWKQMKKILADKFGTARKVVANVLAELDKLRHPTK